MSGLRLTLRCREVDDVAVALEHVDLLNRLDGLDVELLQGALELLVVTAGALVDLLDLSARSTLASITIVACQRIFRGRVVVVKPLEGVSELRSGGACC